MIAPITDADCNSVAVRSDSFALAADIGAALCCPVSQIGATHKSMSAVARNIKDAITPEFIAPPNEHGKFMERAIARCPNTAACVKIAAACIPGALSYGWQALVPVTKPNAEADYAALRFIAPAYIQRTLRQRLSLYAAKSSITLAVLRDLHSWLETAYGSTFNLSAAEQTIMLPDMAHIALMREINTAILAEKIDMLPRPRYAGQKPNYIVRNKQHWWLNKKAINKHLYSAGIVPDWNALINCFTKQGVFFGEDVVQNMPGLLVSREWCDTFWSDYEDTASKYAG
jgi:hypothetical protein